MGFNYRLGKTNSPTSFMMVTKFLNILVITIGKNRKLAKPLNSTQMHYLKAFKVNLLNALLGLDSDRYVAKKLSNNKKKDAECTF